MLNEIVEIHKKILDVCPKFGTRHGFFLATCGHISFQYDFYEGMSKPFVQYSEQCPHGGKIGIGNSALDKCLSWSKLFRLHAALHDAFGYMRSSFNVGPGYCYIWNMRCNNCLLGHVTGLAFCLKVKIFHKELYNKIII
jgi:hypothetical protein